MHLSTSYTYWSLAVLRVLLVFLPQRGYIHPDEFFQSVEVFTGKMFEVSSHTPWEFNITFPVRSIALSYSTVGASLRLLKGISFLLEEYLNCSIITPYFLIVFPRFLMCLLSFIVDYSLYKICVNNNERYKARLSVLASSYVMLIFGTRTFSNTLELVLFASLLYYVAESLTFSNTIIKKREYINLRYHQSKNPAEKVKWNKLSHYLKSDSLRNCFFVSTITVLGFFNRPTFLAFAVGPVFFWLYRGIGCKSVASLQFHLRSLVYILCSLPSIVVIVVIDSFYYGYISWGEIGMLDVTINSFVFTPLNFVKYNIDTDNLKKHGLHPRWLHVVVNIPLLFNMLGILGIVGIATFLYRFLRCQYHLLPTVRSIKGLMMLSASIPVILLSIFPHQEPRFLIPVIFPLVYLHSSGILEEYESALVKMNEAGNSDNLNRNKLYKDTNSMFKLWLIVNAAFVLFYGFVHQAGVLPAVSYLSNELKERPNTVFHVFTSHTYAFPESLLLQADPNKLYKGKGTKYNINKHVFLHQEGSVDLDVTLHKISSMLNEVAAQTSRPKYTLYFVLPSSLRYRMNILLDNDGYENMYAKNVQSFYPHLSVESLPNLSAYCLELLPVSCNNPLTWHEYVRTVASFFGLDLYEISTM